MAKLSTVDFVSVPTVAGDRQGSDRHNAVAPAVVLRERLLEYSLTPREAEIVWLLACGMSNKEIAASCSIAPQTVKDHLKHVYAKIGAHQRTALLARLIGTSL